MSLLATLSRPSNWWEVKLGHLFARVQETGFPQLQSLSVFLGDGVVPRADRADNHNQLGANLGKYQRVRPADIVFNKLRTWQGGFGVSTYDGIVSPAYIVCRPHRGVVEPRYIHHVLRSAPYLAEFTRLSKWMPPSQFDISWDEIRTLPLRLPPLAEQRRIADFLDDQVARIDNIIAARRAQASRLDDLRLHLSWVAMTGSDLESPVRRPTAWLGSLPAGWPMATVHSAYSVMLGKMLDEASFTGLDPLPYLRNTNVQWDRVTTDDLKIMDIPAGERLRFTVQKGDLLICEGGQPGRSAVWDGSIQPIGYQKALHRARPRVGNDVRWLQAFLRVAVSLSVFAIEFGQATIGHLTGEQLRSLRLPMPPPAVQVSRMDRLQRDLTDVQRGGRVLQASVERLGELKRSLITAAVNGEFDVSTADGSGVRV